MKVLLWLGAALILGTVLVSTALGVLYAIAPDDEPAIVITPAPVQRLAPSTPVSVDDVMECLVIAKARGYDVSALRVLINEDDVLTPGEARRLLDTCEQLISR